MNCRLLTVFALTGAAALHAQDKATTPKPDKSAATPKVLTFQPDAKLPAAASDPGAVHGVVVQRPGQANPMLDGPAQIVANFFGSLRAGKIDEGYAALTKDSNIAEKPEELKQLKAKTREAVELLRTDCRV